MISFELPTKDMSHDDITCERSHLSVNKLAFKFKFASYTLGNIKKIVESSIN